MLRFACPFPRPLASLLTGPALLAGLAAGPLTGQVPGDLDRERREFAVWLSTAPLSPYAVIALQPIGTGISIGTEPSDIPLPGLGRVSVEEERGVVVLARDGDRRQLPRDRPVALGSYTLLVSGGPGRTALAAYGSARRISQPLYFPYQTGMVMSSPLETRERHGSFAVLGLDGTETQATEAGFVLVPRDGVTTRLRVYRMGEAEDEGGLYVFFRDATNGKGTYPAGRFVELLPLAGGRYVLDFNRARNPFCAYNTIYPCPAPWPGNLLPFAVEAGERYRGTREEPN